MASVGGSGGQAGSAEGLRRQAGSMEIWEIGGIGNTRGIKGQVGSSGRSGAGQAGSTGRSGGQAALVRRIEGAGGVHRSDQENWWARRAFWGFRRVSGDQEGSRSLWETWGGTPSTP